MSFTLAHLLTLVPVLLVIEGFYSGSEIALLSADKLQLKQNAKLGHRGAQLALELASHPERIFSTTLVMTNLCMITLSALVALFLLERGIAMADLLAIVITSPLVVLLGELTPKTIFQRYANQVAARVAFPIHWTFWALYPVTRLISSYTTKLSKIVGPIEAMIVGKQRSTRDELRQLLNYSKSESELKSAEKRMIRRIFDFKDSEAKHALIPLVRVEAIEESSTVREALDSFERHRHSRMPVYSDRIDNIVGILEAADLFTATDLNQSLRYYVTAAHYVPETQSLYELLKDMKREDNEMVVVVDEHGGAVGILTFEDIVEEIVGEIDDEYDDPEAAPYKELSQYSWLVQARMPIVQMNEKLGLDLPEGDYETLSGFLLQQFGRIPEIRDELFFTTPAGQFRFTIRRASQRHIESVQVDRIVAPSS
jgi:putative hemolysin